MIWLLSVALAAPLEIPEPLIHGQTVEISAPGDTLTVTYRPGSAVARTETVSIEDGVASWTPDDAGIAVLSAEGDDGPVSQNVSIRFSGVPISGLLVFFGAGFLLFGGAAYSLRRLLAEQAEGNVIAVPMDT